MTEAEAWKAARSLNLPRSWVEDLMAYAIGTTDTVTTIGGRSVGNANATRAALLRGLVWGTVESAAAASVLASLADHRQAVAPADTDDSIALGYGGMPEVYPATAAAARRIVFYPENGSRIRVGSVKACGDRIVVYGDDLDGPPRLGPFKMELDPTLRLILASGKGPNPFAEGQRQSQLWKIRSGQNGAGAYATEAARKKRAAECARKRLHDRKQAEIFGTQERVDDRDEVTAKALRNPASRRLFGAPHPEWDPMASSEEQLAAAKRSRRPQPYPGDAPPTKNGWPVTRWAASW